MCGGWQVKQKCACWEKAVKGKGKGACGVRRGAVCVRAQWGGNRSARAALFKARRRPAGGVCRSARTGRAWREGKAVRAQKRM